MVQTGSKQFRTTTNKPKARKDEKGRDGDTLSIDDARVSCSFVDQQVDSGNGLTKRKQQTNCMRYVRNNLDQTGARTLPPPIFMVRLVFHFSHFHKTPFNVKNVNVLRTW